MYLANHTCPDISFAVNFLARYSNAPTLRHWNGVKHIFRYLNGTLNIGLLYWNKTKATYLIGYEDARFKFHPYVGRSHTSYLFTCGVTKISWRSMKQTISLTSYNHVEILPLHEASREYWGN